jgi:hypothetical protein
MKIGVSTVPWGKTKRPRRAELEGSVARRVNDTDGGAIGQMPTLAKPNHVSRGGENSGISPEIFGSGRSRFHGPVNFLLQLEFF